MPILARVQACMYSSDGVPATLISTGITAQLFGWSCAKAARKKQKHDGMTADGSAGKVPHLQRRPNGAGQPRIDHSHHRYLLIALYSYIFHSLHPSHPLISFTMSRGALSDSEIQTEMNKMASFHHHPHPRFTAPLRHTDPRLRSSRRKPVKRRERSKSRRMKSLPLRR